MRCAVIRWGDVVEAVTAAWLLRWSNTFFISAVLSSRSRILLSLFETT